MLWFWWFFLLTSLSGLLGISVAASTSLLCYMVCSAYLLCHLYCWFTVSWGCVFKSYFLRIYRTQVGKCMDCWCFHVSIIEPTIEVSELWTVDMLFHWTKISFLGESQSFKTSVQQINITMKSIDCVIWISNKGSIVHGQWLSMVERWYRQFGW